MDRMAQRPNSYYRPYLSDSEESDTDDTGSTTSSWTSGSDHQPNYRQFASQLQLSKAAGPDFPTNSEQLLFQNPKLMDLYVSDTSGIVFPALTSTKTPTTSVIMLDSRDRDINVYPQPTNLTLRLPRTYKNVTNFQILQINLLSSFFYFRSDKSNITITIQEQGRYLQDTLGITKTAANSKLYPISTSIRPGTYTIDTLVSELNLQLNRTPVFYDFKNGITDFAPLFIASGNYAINFNQPGDNFFDSLNNIFIISPTITQIVQKYFQTTIAGLTSYTSEEVKVAYYYPVLKECLLDSSYGPTKLNLNIADISLLLSDETVFTRCIYTFEGLGDLIIQEVINLNISVLDTYRINHTFRYSLINKYSVSYSTNNNLISITSPSLNTSILSLLTSKYNQYLSDALSSVGLSIQEYNAQTTINTILLAILTDMYNYLQTQLAIHFGINFNSYSLDYYGNTANQLPLQNAFNNTGINQQFTLTQITPYKVNSLLNFQKQSPHYWPQLTGLTNTYVTVSDSTLPYNNISDALNINTLINSDGTMYQNPIYKSVDVVTNILPQQYTVFKFKSLARQTLKVCSLPRPTKYRYVPYNATSSAGYSSAIQALFNNAYSYIDNTNIDAIPNGNTLITIPGFSQTDTNYSIYITDSLAKWSQTSIIFNPILTASYLTFWAPSSSSINPKPHKYTLNFSISYSTDSTAPTITTLLFLYHDRAAFMADITNASNENLLHYKAKWVIQPSTVVGINGSRTYGVVNVASETGVSDPSYSSFYASQQYYFIFRSQSPTISSVQSFILSPYFPLGFSPTIFTTDLPSSFNPLLNSSTSTDFNYAVVNDPDYIKLPVNSSLWSVNKNADSNFSVFGTKINPMGYDTVLGVSTDLTDYIGYTSSSNYVPSSKTRIDPITKYTFYVGLGYNSDTQTYLDVNSAFGNNNKVVPPTNANLSIISPTTRQSSIVHWYNEVFIKNTANQAFISVNDFYQNPTYSYPYTQDIFGSTLVGYSFQDRTLSLGDGIIGISFIPDDGVWDVNKIMLRSSYINPTNDTNRNIISLGIFPSAYISKLLNTQIFLSNATMILDFSTAITYTSSTDFDKGTYYEWTKRAGTTQYLSGFAQSPGKMIPDSNAYYSIVPFTVDPLTGNTVLTTYSLLSGSIVPYPFYSDAIAAAAYLDSSVTPKGKYVLNPTKKANPDITLGPPTGFDQTQSKYEQSIPIGSTLLQYLQPPSQLTFNQFDISGASVSGPVVSLKNILGSAPFTNIYVRVQGYILYDDDGDYTLYKYDRNIPSYKFYANDYESSLSQDLFFTNYPNAQVVAISGNKSVFAFLGLVATSFSGKYAYTFIIETFNPVTKEIDSASTIVMNTPYTPPNTGLFGTSTYPVFQGLTGSEITTVDSFNYNDNEGFTFTIQYRTIGTTTPVSILGVTKGSPVNDTSSSALPFYLLTTPTQWNTPSATVSITASTLTQTTGDAFQIGDVISGTNINSGTYIVSKSPGSTLPFTYSVSGTTSTPGATTVSVSRLPATYQILQSPYEPYGRFYIAAKTNFDTNTNKTYGLPTNLYYKVREPMLVNSIVNAANSNYAQNGLFYVNPNNGTVDLTSSSIQSSLSNIQAPYVCISNTTIGPSVIRINISQDAITPAAFGDITFLQNPYQNKLIVSYDMYNMSNNSGLPSVTYYQETTYTINDLNPNYSSNLSYTPSENVIKDNAVPSSPICPYQILSGGGGSMWLIFNEKIRTSTHPNTSTYSTVWGNRGDNTDFPVNIENAYQIFYPTQRIVMTKMAPSYNPLTDLSGVVYSNSPQLLYPEYPHTAIFTYSTLANLNADISSQWGLESSNNYLTTNYNLSSGYYFNAADLDVPLLSNSTYYVAVRGYSPSEKSQVMMRFSLPNRYDFGYVTIQQLSDEITLSQTNSNNFNSNYLNLIQKFNSTFILSSYTFGGGIVSGYSGSNYTNITGFPDFLQRFINLYNTYNLNLQKVTSITTNTQTNLQNFISTDMAAIIPTSAINRQRYTDPVVYSILWKTGLSSQYVNLKDNWGLGWNLGYDKVDTPYLTTQVAQSFYKILDEYINLRLNTEFDMNHIDTGFKENLQITKDPTGSTKSYYGKLLLNSFGFYSQTMISNPIVFQVPIPKIDKLTFMWYDNLGTIINNNDCEWTAVVQMVELLDIVNVPPAIITPQ